MGIRTRKGQDFSWVKDKPYIKYIVGYQYYGNLKDITYHKYKGTAMKRAHELKRKCLGPVNIYSVGDHGIKLEKTLVP